MMEKEWVPDDVEHVLLCRLRDGRPLPWSAINTALGLDHRSQAPHVLLWKLAVGYPPHDRYAPQPDNATSRAGLPWGGEEMRLVHLALGDKGRNDGPGGRDAVASARLARVLRRSYGEVADRVHNLTARGREGFGL